MKRKKSREPDYEELRRILQTDLGRRVTEQEAHRIGRWILKIYQHLSNTK